MIELALIDLKLLAAGLGVAGAKTELAQRTLGPIADEIGKSLATFGDIFRFYQNDNLGKVFTKWNAARENKHITSEDFRRVLPLLQLASMQSDDELQERWAALLESTASESDNTLPSFAKTLSEINADEARFMDRLMEVRRRKYEGINVGHDSDLLDRRSPNLYPDEMFHFDVVNIYAPTTLSGDGLILTVTQPGVYHRAVLVIDDLIRSGLMQKRYDAFVSGGGDWASSPEASTLELYSLSVYGVRFMEAVTGKSS